MTAIKPVPVNATDLRAAFDFVSAGAPFENSASICLDTGRIFWKSDMADLGTEEDLPADLDTSDRYLPVPHQNDLDLGRRLVLAFIDQELPADHDTVADFFRRRGAYGRFKALLDKRGMLQRWYEFEDRATEQALGAWCEENGIQLVDE